VSWRRAMSGPNPTTGPGIQVRRVGQGSVHSLVPGWQLNVSVQCLDRHLKTKGDQGALYWQGEPEAIAASTPTRSFIGRSAALPRVEEARNQEGRPGGHLHADGAELPIAMLACARIGAIHSIVFGGFSPTRFATGYSTPNASCSSPRTAAIGPARRSDEGERRQGPRERPEHPEGDRLQADRRGREDGPGQGHLGA